MGKDSMLVGGRVSQDFGIGQGGYLTTAEGMKM